MSLRRAKFDDHWRRALSKKYSSRIVSLTYKDLHCLFDAEIQIPLGICAIVGGNGVGKSALLAALSEVVAKPEMNMGPGQKAKVKNSHLVAECLDLGEEKKFTVIDGEHGVRVVEGGEFNSGFHSLEPSLLVNFTHKQLNSDADFRSLLESLSPYDVTADELAVIQYVTGKPISACRIFEINDYGGMDAFPYFEVSVNGFEYGSESMGLGELSILTVVWKLLNIEKNSLLIVEEPETHVSPRSQRALMDVLAKACDEKNLSIILTTHSPAIISRIPQENIVLLSRSGVKSIAVPRASKFQVNELLGASSTRRSLVLVEDRAAKQFLMALVSNLQFELLSQIEIMAVGDYTKIDSLLRTLPEIQSGWLDVVGMYDGDMVGRVNSDGFIWPHLFLPGVVSPEHALHASFMGLDNAVDFLAKDLGRSVGSISVALESLNGQDVHDWFTQLPMLIACEHAAVMNSLVRIWLAKNRDLADSFLIGFLKVLG